MRFLMTTNAGATPPDDVMYEEMGKLVAELSSAGVLLATGGLGEPTHIKSSGNKITATDGPYTEAKEMIVSFALIEARSKEEAVELSKRFWKIAREGEGDIWPVYGPDL
jgi:hypothetical protein